MAALTVSTLLLSTFATIGPSGDASAALAPGRWTRPVNGAVVRPFRAPAHPYGPGHRGVDFAASAGEPVRAAGPGVVSFAGVVAGVAHVVVAHGQGLRTGYSILAIVAVTEGQIVSAGTALGSAGGAPAEGDGHTPGIVHMSLRRGEVYLDPMKLFRPVDLAAIVHLVPAAHGLGPRKGRALHSAAANPPFTNRHSPAIPRSPCAPAGEGACPTNRGRSRWP